MRSRELWGRVALTAAALIWGSAFIIMKDALDGLPVYRLLAIRFTIGFLAAGLIFWRKWRLLTARALRYGAVLGLLEGVAYIVQTFGLAETTPGKNAFLTSIYCILVPFVNWFWFRARPQRRNWLAGLLCLLGIGLIALDERILIGRGDALTLLSGVLYAIQVTAVSSYAEQEDAVVLSLVQFGTAMVLCWLCSLAVEGVSVPVPRGAWLPMLYLGVVSTGAAILLQNTGQRFTPPGQAGILLSLESVFGAAFSVVFGYERMTLRLTAGFIIVFVAVLVSEGAFSRRPGLPDNAR